MPRLPIAALMAICPMVAAAILVYAESGAHGIMQLLASTLDFRRVPTMLWYLPILLPMSAVMAISFGWLRLNGVAIPRPEVSIQRVAGLSGLFFPSALGEELGWSGYALDPLQNRLGALQATIILGLVWAAVHFVPLARADRTVAWIAWWSLETIALRVLIVWLYNNTARSLFAAALFHTTVNVTWQLFPIRGSYFDPRTTGLIVEVIAAFVIISKPGTHGPQRIV